MELYKEFAEEAYSIALHPSGLYVLVGFSDKLRLMNLLIDDIRAFKELTIRGCREVSCCAAISYLICEHKGDVDCGQVIPRLDSYTDQTQFISETEFQLNMVIDVRL